MTWAKISKALGDRSDSQCRYWYNKILQSRNEEWNSKEDEALIELMESINAPNWEFIYKEMMQKKLSKVTRSPLEYKLRWFELLKVSSKLSM